MALRRGFRLIILNPHVCVGLTLDSVPVGIENTFGATGEAGPLPKAVSFVVAADGEDADGVKRGHCPAPVS
jgi:hypothetical protein